MKLPNGITGFYDKKNEPPKTDGKQFKQLCFSFINNYRGTVLDFKEPQLKTNFFILEVNVFNKHIHILLNAHYPFIAFASVANFDQIIFVDEPQLSNHFTPFYYVLSTKELNEPLLIKSSSNNWILLNENKLNNAEMKLIAYWKPKKIGELIFNYWD